MRTSQLAIAALAAVPVFGQQSAGAQCGGDGFTGDTTCVAGYTCVVYDECYSQCEPEAASASSAAPVVSQVTSAAAEAAATSAPATLVTSLAPVSSAEASSAAAAPATTLVTRVSSAAGAASSVASGTAPISTGGSSGSSNSSSDLWWFGVNLSGAEFGENNFPGVYGTDYTWYDESAIDTFISKGMNMFRINFLMERVAPDNLTNSQENAYTSNLTATVKYITGKGAYAMIQPHNYGRYYKEIITDTAGFKTFWQTLATGFADNDLVVFDTNNEYHDMDQDLVVSLNQAAIDGIRAAGAKTQYITPEGNSYTGAWTWVSSGNADSMGNLTDPADSTGSKLIYQMHQYLDSDGSGTNEACVNTTIFKERLVAATNWLKQNNKRGLIGEYAGGNNADCITALQGGLQYLKDNSDVWVGNLWWAAGPWWGDYMYSMEPTDGVAYTNVLPKILSYAK